MYHYLGTCMYIRIPITIIIQKQNCMRYPVCHHVWHLTRNFLRNSQESERSSQETQPIYYSWHCKPSNFRHSSKRSIKRMINIVCRWHFFSSCETTSGHCFTWSIFAKNGVNKCLWHGSGGREMEHSSRYPGYDSLNRSSVPCTQILGGEADWQRNKGCESWSSTGSVTRLTWAARRPSVSNLDPVGLFPIGNLYSENVAVPFGLHSLHKSCETMGWL